ncbi:MAG TPA: GNAT family N-acetyltransferase [Candidatus Eisenbacteria bacterium]
MSYREIGERDVPALFSVRVATRENALSLDELARLGITEASVLSMLRTTHRGWLCEENGRVVAFAMGNRETGEMWVIAVLPDRERRGIGAALLTRVESWLWSEGWTEIWLTTDVDPSLRAYGFYRRQGWMDREIKNGLRYMRKENPNRSGRGGATGATRVPERNRMDLKDLFIPELRVEAATTRRMLERVPPGSLGWRPHDKSRTLGELAGHIAGLPGLFLASLEEDELDHDSYRSDVGTADAILATFDRNVARAHETLARLSDERFHAPWRYRYGDRVIFEMPRLVVARTAGLSHLIHHRGQLSVYLRLLGVPVPGAYGPSADDA